MKLLIESWRQYLQENQSEYPSVKKAKRLKAIGKPDRKSWVAGMDDLDALSKGITEEEGEACGSNPYRNAQGEFSTAKDATVYTTGYADDNKRAGCKDQSKWRASGGGKGSEADKKCGRNPKTGKKYNIRCKDDEVLFQEYVNDKGIIEINKDELEAIITKILDREIDKRIELSEGTSPEKIKQFCNKNGYSSTAQFLYRQNQMVASAKGDLLKDKK